jgi:hypothetical protein
MSIAEFFTEFIVCKKLKIHTCAIRPNMNLTTSAKKVNPIREIAILTKLRAIEPGANKVKTWPFVFR